MRKLLSVILTAAILISSVSVLMLTAFAEDPGYTVAEYGGNSDAGELDASTLGTNLLSGYPWYLATKQVGSAQPTEFVEKTNDNSNGYSTTWLHDGNVSHTNSNGRNGYRFYNGLKTNSDKTDTIAETDSKIIMNMGGIYNISQFLIAGSSNQHPITSFKIYVGDDFDTIFSTTPVAEYTRAEGSTAYHYVVNLDTAITADYFGIEFLGVDTTVEIMYSEKYDTTAIYLNELGAYGEISYNTPTNLTAMPSEKVSRISRATPISVIDYAGTVLADPTVSNNSDSKSSTVTYTNNLADSNTHYARMVKANKITSSATKERGMRMTYDLAKTFDVSEVLLVSGDASRAPETQWKIYVSDNADRLFDESNCFAWVKDDTVTANAITYQLAALSAQGRYVGLEFIKSFANAETAYLSEICIYGNPVGQVQNNLPFVQAPGKNVLNGVTSVDYMESKATTWTEGKTTGGNGNNLSEMFLDTTPSVNNHFSKVFTSSGGYASYIRIDAGEEHTVSSVMVSISNSRNIAYEAYVSNDKDTLFDKSNLFAVCDSITVPSGSGITRPSGVAIVDGNNYKTGRYYGIKIVKAFTTDTDAYFYQIGFYEPSAATVDEATVIEGKNMLEGKDIYWTPGDSSTESLRTKFPSESAGNPVTGLTNNKLTDRPDTKWDLGLKIWKGYRGKMVYDIGQKADITKVLIGLGYNSAEGETLVKSYGIFVSDDKSTLFDINNQVAFYYNVNKSKVASFDMSAVGDKVKSVQYVGIYFYDTRAWDANIYLTEVAVYGNYSTDAYTIINEPADDVLALEGTNALANATTAAEIDNAVLTDGVALTEDTAEAVQIENADGTQLTYNLGKAMNITSLLVGGVYNNANNIAPLHYRIYLSNDEATLYTADNIAVEYYNAGYKANSGNYAASTQLFKLAAAANAQYVGFEFVSAALGSTTLTLSELAAYATYDMSSELSGGITAPSKVYLDGVLVSESASIPTDALTGNHSLVIYDDASNNNVYIINNGVFTYKSEFNNALATVGTQIRTDDPLAIRFVNSIDKNAKESVVKYGAVVAKTAALSSKDLVIDSPDYTTVNGVSYEKGVSDIVFADDGTDVSYTVAIYNIGTKQHLTYYAVRPYLIIEAGGVEYTVYGRTFESRPYDVAKAALEDTNAQYSEKVMTYLNNIADNSSLSTVSKALYTGYALTEESVAASVKNEAANNDRIIRVIQKAMRGEDITLGVLGGSITMGANVLKEDRYAHSYAGILREWLENTFDVKVNLVNAGIGATTSTFGVHRIEKDLLQYNPDLVVLEYAVNENESETTNKTYEDCVRRILASGDDTALILLFTVRYSKLTDNSYNKVTCYYPDQAVSGTTTYYNNQGAQMVIGNNYNLPMISYMDCIVPLIENETLEWKGSTNKGSNLTTDDIHPSYFGHQIIASLLSDYIANIAEDVTADTQTVVETMADALYGATYTNAKFYNSCDLPEEWITSMGSFKAAHDICPEYIDYEILTHGWKANSADKAEPMVLNIPGAKSVTMLMLRTKKIADGIKATVTVTKEDGSQVSKNASNYLNSSSYADTTVVYTADAGEDITLELNPIFNGLEGELVVLGIMVGFDEAQ